MEHCQSFTRSFAKMARETLMFESIIDGDMFICTEMTCENVHVRVIKEHTQNRDAFDSILFCERKRIVDGADDRFWMCLEVLVEPLC